VSAVVRVLKPGVRLSTGEESSVSHQCVTRHPSFCWKGYKMVVRGRCTCTQWQRTPPPSDYTSYDLVLHSIVLYIVILCALCRSRCSVQSYRVGADEDGRHEEDVQEGRVGRELELLGALGVAHHITSNDLVLHTK
jgi:hypothetical protein